MATLRTDAPAPSTLRERLTWKEICERYPNEWVVLVDMEHENDDDDCDVVAGVVLGHSKNRADCLRETRPLRPSGIACAHLYTGELIAPLLPARYL
jgi:hypothetical protein